MTYIKGWFEWAYGESLIYLSEEAWDKGSPYHKDVIRLSDVTQSFNNKKIKIIIEVED